MVVMVYAFVSLLVCIELPREALDKIQFPLDGQGHVASSGRSSACTVDTISIGKATLTMHDEAAFGQTRLGDILIFTPFPDLDVAGQVSAMDRARSGMSLSIVGIRDRRDAWKITKTAQGVREKMVQRIFSEMPEVMPRRAHPLAAGKGLWKRVFARPSVLIGDLEPNTVTAQAQHGSPRHHKPRFFTRRTPFLQIGDRVAPPLAE